MMTVNLKMRYFLTRTYVSYTISGGSHLRQACRTKNSKYHLERVGFPLISLVVKVLGLYRIIFPSPFSASQSAKNKD